MSDRYRRFHHLLRIALAGGALALLAACSDGAGSGANEAPALAPQASGSFSGGSLRRGSVEGLFEGVGLGNTPHVLSMTVSGVQWFECRNHGGNLAPGQFAFTNDVVTPLDGFIDENGRFEAILVEEGPQPTDADCKNNWTVDRTDGVPVTFLQVAGEVRAVLYEGHVDDDRHTWVERDTYVWRCDDPEPIAPIAAYDPPPLTGEGGVCSLVTDGSERGGNGGGKGNGRTR